MKAVITPVLAMTLSFYSLAAQGTQGTSEPNPRAAEMSAPEVIPHADWRAAIHSEFTFNADRTNRDVAPLASTAEQSEPEAITLARLIVYSRKLTPEFRNLEKVFRAQDEEQRREVLNEKLGIKVHVYKVKNVLFGYGTLFFIPVSFGVGW
jgi:hypothetical protein